MLNKREKWITVRATKPIRQIMLELAEKKEMSHADIIELALIDYKKKVLSFIC